MSAKDYLGDGVYVAIENDQIKLTAEDGRVATDTIFLEPEVFGALLAWWEATKAKSKIETVTR